MKGLSLVHRRVAGIDVQRMLHDEVTVPIERPDGSIERHRRDFGKIESLERQFGETRALGGAPHGGD